MHIKHEGFLLEAFSQLTLSTAATTHTITHPLLLHANRLHTTSFFFRGPGKARFYAKYKYVFQLFVAAAAAEAAEAARYNKVYLVFFAGAFSERGWVWAWKDARRMRDNKFAYRNARREKKRKNRTLSRAKIYITGCRGCATYDGVLATPKLLR